MTTRDQGNCRCMSKTCDAHREALWASQNEEFRDPAEIVAYWQDADKIDPRLLEYEVRGKWWETLEESGATLLVTREYEHLVMALRVDEASQPVISMMRLPHPSGLAVDRVRGVVHVAATRNPNQLFDFVPVGGLIPRLDVERVAVEENLLVPVRTRFLPGCLYIHDLAMIGGELHANSVGQNAVVRLAASGAHRKVWWPRCIETDNGPIFGQNHLQLNSIAAGEDLRTSFFSASTDEVTDLRPGDPGFPVDKRGVIFSGELREPIARGLTRPHSARQHGMKVWVDNSGYGEVGYLEDKMFRPIATLPGWTRGLCFLGRMMVVGTSRILPRFRAYAPGVDLDRSRCGLHALDSLSGEVLGSIVWPFGSQIFSVEWVPSSFTTGFPFRSDAKATGFREKLLFYAFELPNLQEDS